MAHKCVRRDVSEKAVPTDIVCDIWLFSNQDVMQVPLPACFFVDDTSFCWPFIFMRLVLLVDGRV